MSSIPGILLCPTPRRPRANLEPFGVAVRLLQTQPQPCDLEALEQLANLVYGNWHWFDPKALIQLLALLAAHPGVQAKFKALQAEATKAKPLSLRELGASYAYGLHGHLDPSKAIPLFKRAAGKGDASSARMLGALLASDEGVALNPRLRPGQLASPRKHGQPMDWFLRAAQLGDPNAIRGAVQWLLAPVVPLDRYEEALRLLKVAQARGDKWAVKVAKGVQEWRFEDGSKRVRVEWAKGVGKALVAVDFRGEMFEVG